MMTGTLTRNTEPHQKCSSRKPEATGPMAAPPPAMPAQTAMALGRSSGGKTLVRMDSVAGMTKAAARPITARAPMTSVEESPMAASTRADQEQDAGRPAGRPCGRSGRRGCRR